MTTREPTDRGNGVLRRVSAVLLILGVWAPIDAPGGGDPAESTVISAQTVRRALDLATGKQVRIQSVQVADADKAEVGFVENYELDFGTLADRSGSVLLGADGSIQENNDFIYYGGTTRAAEFVVTGDPLVQVRISFSSTPAGGFTLDDFVTNSGPPPISEVLNGSGEILLTIGARLTVDSAVVETGSDQVVGYTITAVYP